MATADGIHPCPVWHPVAVAERHQVLDLVRGFALFGVLLINLLYFFRLHLFGHILKFHSHAGMLNQAIDLFAKEFVEFKAFDLFALTFGIGTAIQAERALSRKRLPEIFLVRRFLVLLLVGTCHMVLVSNVDILMLYAVCGLCVIPLLRLPAPALATAGLAAIFGPSLLGGWDLLPPANAWPDHVAEATRIYATANFTTLVRYRWHETQGWILPLLVASAQQVWGLMLVGAALWRAGVVEHAGRYRAALWKCCAVCAVVGLLNTTPDVLAKAGIAIHQLPLLGRLGGDVPLAFAYASTLLAWRRPDRLTALPSAVAAAGRMALTNYLTQSLIFGALFYGYGFQLFGRLDPATATALGVTLYGAQLWFSAWWLERYQFGPFEWAWRSATYGRLQPMRRGN